MLCVWLESLFYVNQHCFVPFNSRDSPTNAIILPLITFLLKKKNNGRESGIVYCGSRGDTTPPKS